MRISYGEPGSEEYAEALDFLEGLIKSGIKLGLDNTRKLLEAVGNPHDELRFIHVAGTNGKGSVCTLLAAALHGCGYRTGFFSSPHLVNVRERVRVDGQAISETEFAELTFELRDRAASRFHPDQPYTFFEFMAALAFLYFRRRDCEIVVAEVGMGGRLDATNVITPLISVITSIGLDHTKPLGKTLAAIAGEKAGIIKPHVPVVFSAQPPEVLARLRETAAEQNAPILESGREFAALDWRCNPKQLEQVNTVSFHGQRRTLTTRLVGPHQFENAAVAWATLCQLPETGLKLDLDRAATGMACARWPARLQLLADDILLDAAHNPAGVRALTATLRKFFPGKRWHLLFGVLEDKDWREMLGLLTPLCASLSLAPIDHPRGEPPANLREFVAANWPELPVAICADAGAGLETLRRRGAGLIAGSLYLAGEVLDHYCHGAPVPIEETLPT